MNAPLLAALLTCSGLPPGLLLAQAEPGPAVRQSTPGAPTPPPSSVPLETPAPIQLEVSDPLLEPVPPAPKQVSSWAQALDLLRQRSTELRTALAQVESAAGLRRIALASLLPSLTGVVSVQYNVLDPDATTFLGGGGGGVTGGVGGGGTGSLRPTSPPFLGTLSASVPILNLQAYTALGTATELQRTAALGLAETRRQLTGALAQALVAVSAR
ncbi:TolC family protein, partial [Pyxidicoccus sp. 3LG]